jgi:hypothetical protein
MRGHVPVDCYKLRKILDCTKIGKAIAEAIGYQDRYPDFGFNVWLDKSAADNYRSKWTETFSKKVAAMFVTVEVYYRYANKICMTWHGSCITAKEMIMKQVCEGA